TNRDIKVIEQEYKSNKLITNVEGLSGETYKLGVTNSDKIKSIKGAEMKDGFLVIKIPDETKNQFVRHEITIEMK
ncbi:MAG: hypothetical protein N3A61_01510, partial [Ignavibacteria bacterium]|nr:hypothetical protein [Ignavibacteria bacterium]